MSTPDQPPTQWIDAAQVQAMIDSQIAALSEQHEKDMSSLQAQLDNERNARATLVQTLVPENAGGPGTEIRETWSAAEQAAEHAKREAALQQ